MPWDRGAWERATSGEYNSNPDSISYSDSVFISKPKFVSNEKNKYLKNILANFISQGWNISQKKKEQYLENNYFNAPYRLRDEADLIEKICDLILGKSNKSKFLVVCDEDLILDEIKLEFSIRDNFRIFKSSKSANQLENLVNNVEEFEEINENLFSKYAIKIFSDVESIDGIQYLDIINKNLYYIENKDAKLLNEFLKSYWKYYELSNFSNVDLTLAERDVSGEISEISNRLKTVKNYLNRLIKIFDLLDIDIDKFEDFDIELIKNNPSLIDENEANNFLHILEKYNKINTSEIASNKYFETFFDNEFIVGILANFKRYTNFKKDYEEVNKNIADLKHQFDSNDMNFSNLKEYVEIKDKLSAFKNVDYVEDDNYLILNRKLEEFLNFNLSFDEYLHKCKSNLAFNSNSNSIYLNANRDINKIISLCTDIGMKCNSLSDFDNHKKDLDVLLNYIKFNRKNTVANKDTIKEYANNLFKNLKDISVNLFRNTIEVDESDLDSIMFNISIIKRLISKIGLNISSLNEINDSFLIIANVENDISNEIFSDQTSHYVQNEKFEIHNDLDNLRNSIDYLINKLQNQQILFDYSMDELSESFNDQFKIGFLKSNIEYLLESNNFDDILENYEELIQNLNDLMDLNKNYELKNDLIDIQGEFESISKMYETHNYSSNQLIIENIFSYKNSINKNFDDLVRKGVFSREKLNDENICENIIQLNKTVEGLRDFITFNNYYNYNFKDILSANNEILQNNETVYDKIEKSDIYNFYEVLSQINNQNHEYNLANEILNLSLKLNIKEYDDFKNYSFDEVVVFSKSIKTNIEFSDYVDKNILNKNFNYSEELFEDINSKIDHIKTKLIDLKLNDSILNNFSQINVDETDEILVVLNKIEEHIQITPANVDEAIENCNFVVDNLLNLCNDYFIEFEINEHKFNSSDFKFNLMEIKDDLDSHVVLYKTEKELMSFQKLIENNLGEIWKGPLTDYGVVKNKFETDVEFTKFYNKGIYTRKSLKNISEISQSDLIFLEDFKNMGDDELKSKYIVSFKNHELLIPEINKLNNLNKDDLSSFLKIFININKIYKSKEISDCINLLEYNIMHTDLISLINDAEKNLKPYSIIYYKYFGRREFNMTIEEIIERIQMHFKFTKLIDLGIINQRYLDEIKNNFDDFLKDVIKLNNLGQDILDDCKSYFGRTNLTFDEIKLSWEDIDEANLVLMNLESLRNSFNSNYSTYFDFVYVVDNDQLTGEDKLHLFLISKNRLSMLKLKEEL